MHTVFNFLLFLADATIEMFGKVDLVLDIKAM